VWNGQNIRGGTEELPYLKKHLDSYNKTKELAEKAVVGANGHKGLRTVALRPSGSYCTCYPFFNHCGGIFGPGDQQGLPGFLQVAREGKTRVQIGNGKNLFDLTYVENVAHGHVLAADKLTEGSAIAGQVGPSQICTYFTDLCKSSSSWSNCLSLLQMMNQLLSGICRNTFGAN
jgi:sterol-4alpha-carboxylate 3-dehydrogenase (decarboxylating)